jgi:hypothetical protein
LLSPSPPPSMPAFTAPIIGWLLHCFLPSAFVIARHHATVDAFVASCFCCQSLFLATTAAAAAAEAATTAIATTVVKLTVVHCQRKRQYQPHHQHTNGSINVKTFTSPVNLDLFNLSTVFEVCDVGQRNLAISKLLSFFKNGPFLRIYILLDESLYIFGRWCDTYFNKKTLSATPRPLNHWKAEDLSFLHVLLVLCVNLGLSFNKKRQSSNCISFERILDTLTI